MLDYNYVEKSTDLLTEYKHHTSELSRVHDPLLLSQISTKRSCPTLYRSLVSISLLFAV